MSGLSALWPCPEPVTLGGAPLRAVCFRLRDLARLEGIAAALAGDPLTGRRWPLALERAASGGDYLADSDGGRAYAAALRSAIGACRAWPPPLGTAGADRLLADGPGLVLWLDVLLARTNPGFDAALALRLLPGATPEEWTRLRAVAYAEHPLDELDRLMDPMPPRRLPGPSWGERIVKFVEVFPAYTIEAVGDLHLSQWHALVSGGKDEPGRIPGPTARTRAVAARRRQLMAGGRGGPGRNGNVNGTPKGQP